MTLGGDVVDVATWAGSIPAASGVAPRLRLGRRWFNLLWLLPIGFVLLLGCVAAAKGLRTMPSVQRFISDHPGTDLRAYRGSYLGIPVWARWQHFFNLFLMVFILRSGLQILADHPRLYWTRLSLDWPADNGWVAYNGLQLLAYFVTVFVAAPLALITGLGMSPALSTRFRRISRVLSIQTARSVHFLVFAWFCLFIVVHVSLVVTTGLLTNLNHIDTGRNDASWLGFWIFAGWLAVVIVAWVAATPVTLRHPRIVQRVGYALIGPAERLFEHVDVSPGQYTEADISRYFWHNGRYPDSAEYTSLQADEFADYRLRIGGLVARPVELSLAQLRDLAPHEQITQHFCIQGWSGIAKWGGVAMSTILDLVEPDPSVRWVVFYSLGEGADGGSYYDAHPIAHMRSPLTMLAYDMNDAPLTFGHGAPLRLRNEVELGFKQVKWIRGIEFVAHFADIGSGYGGYNQDHEFFGYRQSI